MPLNEHGLLDLSEIKQRVDALAAKIDAPEQYLPTYGWSDGMATPHIEVDYSYNWVVSERGREYERRRTRDINELLYWVFSAVASSMALRDKKRVRNPHEDWRRCWFAAQLDILGRLSPTWRLREQERIDEILAEYPYDDSLPG